MLSLEVEEGWAFHAVLMAVDPFAIRCYESVGFEKMGLYRIAILKEPITLEK